MSFNIWTPQGQLSGLSAYSNPNVIYEGSAKILSGTVFKMWATLNNGAGGLYYFESLDGLTSWTAHPSNPIGVGTGFNFPTVYKVRGTYYCYSGAESDQIYVRTSSDGISWGTATQAIPRGATGAWDDTDVTQLNLVLGTPGFGTGTGETYYAYYNGIHTFNSIGLATSTNLINWTKSPSNPILIQTAWSIFQNVNGTYYMWAADGGPPGSLASQSLGFNGITRWSAPSPTGPWTRLTYAGNTVLTMYPTLRADFDVAGTGNNVHGVGIGDPNLCYALGNIYLYWDRATNEVSNQYGLNAAVALSCTPAQQVASYEGMVGFPTPVVGFNLNVLATDNFQRANANPMGGNWSPQDSGKTSQIASNLVEPSSTANTGNSYYNAISWPNDQWSQITAQTNQSSYLGPEVRITTGAPSTAYACYWHAASGLGTVGTLTLTSSSGSFTTTFTALTLNQGDTIMLVISGTNLLAYYNNYPILAGTDASFSSGSAGFINNTAGQAVTFSQISGWSGGGFQAAPPAPLPLSGSGAITHQQLRKWRG